MDETPVEEEEGAERRQPWPNLGRGVSAAQENKKQSTMVALALAGVICSASVAHSPCPASPGAGLSGGSSCVARLKAICAFPLPARDELRRLLPLLGPLSRE